MASAWLMARSEHLAAMASLHARHWHASGGAALPSCACDLGVKVESELARQILDGWGATTDGEDRFDGEHRRRQDGRRGYLQTDPRRRRVPPDAHGALRDTRVPTGS